MVEIFLGFESVSKVKRLTQIDSLADADAMPKLRFHLSRNHISIVALDL